VKNPVIISLGGSLIVPDGIDTAFLSEFKKLIEDEVKQEKSFVIVTGGGKICRRYQAAGKEIAGFSQTEIDWIGIYVLRLNAEFVRMLFGSLAHERVVIQPSELESVTKPVVLCGAEAPGHSTDFDAVEMAAQVGATKIVNLSNIDFVYDKDPKRYLDAVKIARISWSAFRKIIPEKWAPGLNSPFDPIAAARAQELGLEVAIMNGKPLTHLADYLAGKSFVGTVISPK